MSGSLHEFTDKIKKYSDAELMRRAMFDAAIFGKSLCTFDKLANEIIDELIDRALEIGIPLRDRSFIKRAVMEREDPVTFLESIPLGLLTRGTRNAAPSDEVEKMIAAQRGSRVYSLEDYFLKLQHENNPSEQQLENTCEPVNSEPAEPEIAADTDTTDVPVAEEGYEVSLNSEPVEPEITADTDTTDVPVAEEGYEAFLSDPRDLFFRGKNGELLLQIPPQVVYAPPPVIYVPIYPGKIYINRILISERDDPDAEQIAELKFECGNEMKVRRIPMADLYSGTKLLSLAKYGALINSGNAGFLAKYFFDWMSEYGETLKRDYMTKSIGWVGKNFDSFVPYYSTDVYYNPDYDKEYKSIIKEFGTYKEWAMLVNKFRDENHIPYRIILATSFASVLAEPIMKQSFILHIHGRSQSGKTPAVMLIASVWADPNLKSGYIKPLSGSDEALEMGAQFYGSLPYCLDETEMRASKEKTPRLTHLVHLLTDIMPKPRGKGSGGLRLQQSWCNASIITGELDIINQSEHIGELARVFDLPIMESIFSDDEKETEHLIDGLLLQYGTAGPEFVRRLLSEGGLDQARNLYDHCREQIPNNIEKRQKHIAATIITADNLIAEWLFEDTVKLTVADLLPYLKRREIGLQEIDYTEVQNTINEWIRGEVGDDYTVESDKGRVINGRMFAFYKDETLIELLNQNDADLETYLNWAQSKGILVTNKKGDGYKHPVASRRNDPKHKPRLYTICLPKL